MIRKPFSRAFPQVATTQVAAVCYRLRGTLIEFLLVNTSAGKWTFPKGRVEPSLSGSQSAEREAWEEAGLVGALRPEPVGSYCYEKDGQVYHVLVFLLHVTEAADDWPERALRQRCWLTPTRALGRFEDQGLRELVRLVVTARDRRFGKQSR